MGYKDWKKRELLRELKEEWPGREPITSAMDLYNLGRETYEAEQLDRFFPNRGCPWIPRTPLGQIAVERYLRGKPERRLP